MKELTGYLTTLYKDFADNRRILEPEWERNARAYSMTEGYKVNQKLGVGNKNNPKDKEDWRSKSVSDLTRVKTNAGKILVCDVLLVGGEIPMQIKENRTQGNLVEKVLSAGENDSPDGRPEGKSTGCDLMKRLIKEQLVQANADVALQKCVKSAAIYGEGISRIYTDTVRREKFTRTAEGWEEQEITSECLKMRNVSVWHFFTDLEDRDIQNNLGIFERSGRSQMTIRPTLPGRWRNSKGRSQAPETNTGRSARTMNRRTSRRSQNGKRHWKCWNSGDGFRKSISKNTATTKTKATWKSWPCWWRIPLCGSRRWKRETVLMSGFPGRTRQTISAEPESRMRVPPLSRAWIPSSA